MTALLRYESLPLLTPSQRHEGAVYLARRLNALVYAGGRIRGCLDVDPAIRSRLDDSIRRGQEAGDSLARCAYRPTGPQLTEVLEAAGTLADSMKAAQQPRSDR
ncbi:hypothetical protein [Streptomyces sp. WM6378]|uniref:hypothetical protein n=1 Tax=Streptomyces sp. WM6378 TaxID=1415557 RepID=UPI0006AEA0FE|nr:hypothetical protein [Streptomyces sp. WM6378]KOU50092.1 hypothetical protein ADK54_10040 [Streptomyces sp. WM6378]